MNRAILGAVVVGFVAGLLVGATALAPEDLAPELAAAEDDNQALRAQLAQARTAAEGVSRDADDEPDPPPPPPAGPTVVETYSGSGIQSLRPFTVSDDWEIRWSSSGDLIQIYLNDASGELVDIVANQQGGGGSSYQAQGGRFALEVNAIGPWTVEVVQL